LPRSRQIDGHQVQIFTRRDLPDNNLSNLYTCIVKAWRCHEQILDAALAVADPREWTFRIADVIAALPALNPGSVRTHVASRCCVNAPAHHQSRHRYFRAMGRGEYRIEPALRRRLTRRRGWQDRILSAIDSGVDPALNCRIAPMDTH
jgi:hypothetical protein